LQGVLLEALAKEVLSKNHLHDEELEQMDFLDEKRRVLRNPYLHFNQIRLTKDILVPGLDGSN